MVSSEDYSRIGSFDSDGHASVSLVPLLISLRTDAEMVR